MIWTRKEFVRVLEEWINIFVGDEGEYAKGYCDAIDDVLTFIDDECGCFRESGVDG